jgi:hypothetical protein
MSIIKHKHQMTCHKCIHVAHVTLVMLHVLHVLYKQYFPCKVYMLHIFKYPVYVARKCFEYSFRMFHVTYTMFHMLHAKLIKLVV